MTDARRPTRRRRRSGQATPRVRRTPRILRILRFPGILRIPRVGRLLGLGFLVLLLAPFLIALVLRYVPPYRSALMIQLTLTGETGPRGIDQTWVSLDEISPQVALAVIASEDQKFPTHRGFDADAIRSAIEERQEGGRLRGASTITQQVAKNVFLWPGRNYVRKGLEAGWTVILELVWPKRRILEVYLNVAEFGEGVFGVEAASQRFFRKSARDLTADEAALLAAVLPSPKRLRADAPSPYVRERQRWILGQMRQLGVGYTEEIVRRGR